MVRLVGHVEPLVGPGEVAGGVELGMVQLERVGPGVLVDVGAGADLVARASVAPSCLTTIEMLPFGPHTSFTK